MILSYHPCFVGDLNLLCAGRMPDETDRDAIARADAVILPQGCSNILYEMARTHCARVFPDYDKRFACPGKIGQIRLFRKENIRHPETSIFPTLADFHASKSNAPVAAGFSRPFVFKFDWGGEGHNVMRIDTATDLKAALEKAALYEKSGQKGFLLQEYVPAGGRSLRVVVIGDYVTSYWRVQPDNTDFSAGISQGALIDMEADPRLQKTGMDRVRQFCSRTGINLAGFDLLFADPVEDARKNGEPYFLEINYFFGRTGLGGSLRFYELLVTQIKTWLRRRGLAVVREFNENGDSGRDEK
jgi:ribosomal protein S6--L-glutamate ligase